MVNEVGVAGAVHAARRTLDTEHHLGVSDEVRVEVGPHFFGPDHYRCEIVQKAITSIEPGETCGEND